MALIFMEKHFYTQRMLMIISVIELMKTLDIFSTFSGLKSNKSKIKTLAISKIVHLALVKIIPTSTLLELDKIKKHFIQQNGNPKIKHETLCKDCENGGLKNVNITFKIRIVCIDQTNFKFRAIEL